jgi:hypothetical protein
MPKKIAGETVEIEPKSREGSVYITNKHVYKLFGGRTNPYEVLATYKTAEQKGVPVSDTAKFTAELQDGLTITSIQGIRSSRASGRFFQLSKAGGEAALINEIRMAQNRELLGIILKGLQSAGEVGLTDPQGFISVNSNPPICFIDVHLRGIPTGALD